MNKKPSIWCLIKEHWKYNLLYILITVIVSAIYAFNIYALSRWIGSITEYAQNKSNVVFTNNFYFWTIVTSVSLILELPIVWFSYRYRNFIDVKNALLLSKFLISKITSLDYQKFHQKGYGNYLSWYKNDRPEIHVNFINGIYDLIEYFFDITFITITLFLNNWIMAIIIICLFIIINLLPIFASKKLQNIALDNSKIIEMIYGKLQKTLDLWTFFSFKNLRNKFYQLFIKGYGELRKENLKKNLFDMPYDIFLKVVFIIGNCLSFLITIVLKNHGLIKISGTVGAVLTANSIFYSGFNRTDLLLRFSSIKKIFNKIFDLPNSLIPMDNIVNNISGFFRLYIKNLSYQYQDQNQKVIKNFSYQFDRGKKYLIMAPSGYGKSTLVKIMAGLYKDYEGNVLWNNNQELKYINDKLLRKYVSYVDNNNYILEDESFETNINMWSEFNQERFDRIVKLLGITNLKGHFDQHKNALSEGQKQKIAIARMLYQNKPIILLDEALDNIDQNYKKHLMKVFQNLASWKTLIMITHNIKPEHKLMFDEVIYLDQLKV